MANASFLSQDWYRVAPLRPRLRSHVEIHRQRFRGQIWYIVQDLHSGKYHRISPAGNYIVSLMDGRRSMQSLWEAACDRFEDDPPSQPDVIGLMAQLHASDLIAGDVPPDFIEMGQRFHDQSQKTLLSRLRNPLALRFPMMDPDGFLNATNWLVRPIFSVWGFLAWLALVVTGVTLAVMSWSELTDSVADKVLSAENLFLIAIAYPLIKAIHELGHAYATKAWGGEVHEVGFMLLVLIPVPYVDASSSAAFPEKTRRAVVGGAGIMVELALAAMAMIFWVNAEPGLARAFAFNIMLIGGVSTLLFNGNPLLRFDGYFVFADLIEIPNLGQRSNKYFWYLVKKYLLGIRNAENPVSAKGERGWFLFYSVAAFLYRVSISIGISLFIASKLFFVGILLAIWALSNVFVFPVFKGLKFVLTSGSLRGRRLRAVTLTALVVAVLVGGITALPVPHATMANAVVWLDEEEILRAETDGFVSLVGQEDGHVVRDAILMELSDPILDSQTKLAEIRLQEIQLRLASVVGRDLVQSELLRAQERHLKARLALFNERKDALVLRATRDGRVLIPNAQNLKGQMVRKGAVVGYLLKGQNMRLLVAVPEGDAELVRNELETVDLRMADQLDRPIPAHVVSSTPEGQPILPSTALSTTAGGNIILDPSDPEQRRTLETLFLFQISPNHPLPVSLVGSRAVVRFGHGKEPLGRRIFRGLRQLFLRQFNV